MTIVAALPLDVAAINTELGVATGTAWSTANSAVYGLAGKAAGATISFSDFLGKTRSATTVSVSVTPASPYFHCPTANNTNATISATASATGGTGTGYTYAWTYVSGDSFTITAPSAATTSFSKVAANGTSFAGVYKCTVTDSGANVGSVSISVGLDGF